MNWNATEFFSHLTECNKFAQDHHFKFCKVSGLNGFEEALGRMLSTQAFVCISDIGNGYTDIENTPHNRTVKTVFLAVRHKIDSMDARLESMETLRELFRQFMSVLIREKTLLAQDGIYLDGRIQFNEIDQYFFSGCACAYFQIYFNKYINLTFNSSEWTGDIADAYGE